MQLGHLGIQVQRTFDIQTDQLKVSVRPERYAPNSITVKTDHWENAERNARQPASPAVLRLREAARSRILVPDFKAWKEKL